MKLEAGYFFAARMSGGFAQSLHDPVSCLCHPLLRRQYRAISLVSFRKPAISATLKLPRSRLLLSFRGINTQSLSAQGEQRRPPFFNIRRDIAMTHRRMDKRTCA
jgi:hypothetical protein